MGEAQISHTAHPNSAEPEDDRHGRHHDHQPPHGESESRESHERGLRPSAGGRHLNHSEYTPNTRRDRRDSRITWPRRLLGSFRHSTSIAASYMRIAIG